MTRDKKSLMLKATVPPEPRRAGVQDAAACRSNGRTSRSVVLGAGHPRARRPAATRGSSPPNTSPDLVHARHALPPQTRRRNQPGSASGPRLRRSRSHPPVPFQPRRFARPRPSHSPRRAQLTGFGGGRRRRSRAQQPRRDSSPARIQMMMPRASRTTAARPSSASSDAWSERRDSSRGEASGVRKINRGGRPSVGMAVKETGRLKARGLDVHRNIWPGLTQRAHGKRYQSDRPDRRRRSPAQPTCSTRQQRPPGDTPVSRRSETRGESYSVS